MACSCESKKSQPAAHTDGRSTYYQELLDCAAETNRLDANNPQCKRGKLCNGRCIPQSHQCGKGGGALKTGAKIAAGVAALAGAGALAYKKRAQIGSAAGAASNTAREVAGKAATSVRSQYGAAANTAREVAGKAKSTASNAANSAATSINQNVVQPAWKKAGEAGIAPTNKIGRRTRQRPSTRLK